jgi:hypothetical protein
MTVATDRSQTRARNPRLSATVPPLAAGWASRGGGQPSREPPSSLILLTDLLMAFMSSSDSTGQIGRTLQASGLSFERAEGGAAQKCSNRTSRNQPSYDPVRTAHLRHRPAPTPMPPDGKEKVYGSNRTTYIAELSQVDRQGGALCAPRGRHLRLASALEGPVGASAPRYGLPPISQAPPGTQTGTAHSRLVRRPMVQLAGHRV